jgi:hypothetical protein
MERPLPPDVAKQVPAGMREAYEIKPGRQPTKSHNPGSFVPGVCYLIGKDGMPIKDERVARDEERQMKAQAEMREAEWERSGLLGPSESEATRSAYAAMEGRETV